MGYSLATTKTNQKGHDNLTRIIALIASIWIILIAYSIDHHKDESPRIPLTHEQCEEDEVLIPTEFDGPAHATYNCIILDDFADPDSIARLDAILANR